jgi:hypothetical protein
MMNMRQAFIPKSILALTALAIALLASGGELVRAQVVNPISPMHYVPGIIGIRDVATPPPGLFLIWYNYGFTSNQFIDRDGNKVENILQGNVPVDIDIGAWATVPVLAYSSRRSVLGGARYIAAIAPNFFVADAKIEAFGGGDSVRVVEGGLSGFSDLVVAPVGLSWALGRFPEGAGDPRDPLRGLTDEQLFTEYGMAPRRRFNATLVYSFAAPTGRYEFGASDNLGLGFWSHLFQGFGYFYPFDHQALVFQAGATFETNSKIKDTDVRLGNRLSLEYGTSLFVNQWLELGVGGTNNWQISDDTGDGVFWDPSVHDRKHGVNFTAAFMPVFMRLYIVAKYGFDYGARQRFDGHNFVLNLYYITGVLDGR